MTNADHAGCRHGSGWSRARGQCTKGVLCPGTHLFICITLNSKRYSAHSGNVLHVAMYLQARP